MKTNCNQCGGTGRVEAVGADTYPGETDFCLQCYGSGEGEESEDEAEAEEMPEAVADWTCGWCASEQPPSSGREGREQWSCCPACGGN